MIGAYCAFFVQTQDLPFLAAVPLALLVCGFLGLVVERVLVRPLYARPFDTLLATWGLSMLLREAGRGGVTDEASGASRPPPHRQRRRAGGGLSVLYRLLLTALSIGLVAGAGLVVRAERHPARRIRAIVNNPPSSPGSVGIPVTSLAAQHVRFRPAAWRPLAGVMLAPLLPVNPALGLDFILKSFFVLVVGGLGSLVGLISGSGVIGGVESVVSAVSPTGLTATPPCSSSRSCSLWLRPNGLFPRT